MEKMYQKLVRDNIPEIIRQDGAEPKTRTLEQAEYLDKLLEKLEEEIIELQAARENKQDMAKEIGDVYEVLEAIIQAFGLSKEEIIKLQEERRQKRGGFDKKIFLESVN